MRSGANEVQNKAGLFGAYTAGLLNDFFGIGALLWPCIFATLGLAHISTRMDLHWWRWCGLFLLTLCLLACASALDFTIGDLSGGGMLGNALLLYSVRYLSPFGSFLLWLFIFLAGMQLTANLSWISLCQNLWEKIRHKYKQLKSGSPIHGNKWQRRINNLGGKLQPILSKTRARLADLVKQKPQEPGAPLMPDLVDVDSDDPFAPSQTIEANSKKTSAPEFDLQRSVEQSEYESARAPEAPTSKPMPITASKAVKHPISRPREFVLPSPDLLQPSGPVTAASPRELEARGRALMSCFNDFDIQGELARITPGPVVTMYEVRPAPGIRVSRIANLADDLSLALKAIAVRIQAPIPGTDTVGIEIPNDNRETVNFRELVESSAFQKGAGALTMILGKDIAGKPFMADLARMPHMLVAGATGAGKSVCLNSILISLLYRMPPDRLRLLLVDPKRIEMAVYADLPHLVHPVVTEMEDATNALAWAVAEMENRFKTFMRLGVRNISAYHEKLASFGKNPPENLADLEPMPYMVIVIDELADLMLTAAREVEGKIQRLAQLARAAGIHMILATQRPSVDVVTGLIKAQFPCRISFQVSSRHDSRTILDEMGAEHLLGRGDMLFKPPGCRLLRLHGPFVSDEEVQDVVAHWKAQQEPDYQVDFSQWGQEAANNEASIGGDATGDSLYNEARSFVLDQSKPSISLLQRHLRIGYNRAARLMEQFRREGIIGSQEAGRQTAR